MTLDLQQAARDHLWMHFTRMGAYGDAEVPIIVRGDGCYLEDCERQALPRRARRAVRRAARVLARRRDRPGGARADEGAAVLHQLVVRASARDRAGARGREPRAGRPEPRLLRLGRLRGGRVGVEARAPVPPGARRAPLEGDRAPHRVPRHDDGRALDQRHRCAQERVRAARARHAARAEHEPLPPAARGDARQEFTAFLLDDLEQTIIATGPGTVAMVIMEPVQNAGGAFTPPAGLLPGRARDLRPLRDPALRRRGDHRLRPRRRLVRVRALRHPPRPDHVGEGALVGLRVDRRRDRDRPRLRAVPRDGAPSMYTHGITFGGHPVQCAIALKNIEIMKRERVLENVRDERGVLPRARSSSCSSSTSSATCAEPATSTRSSSSRTRRRAKASRRGVRDAAARLPVAAAVRARADLPRRRPRRPGDPDLAAARRRRRPRSTRSRGRSATVLAEAQDRMHVTRSGNVAHQVQPGTRLVGEA